MPSVKINNLNFYFKKKKEKLQILKDFSADFEANKISVIIGNSGCGKTTLLRTILGLEKYEGTIFYDDINIDSLKVKDRNIAYVSQNITLFPYLTAFENIAFPLKLLHCDDDEIRSRVKDIAYSFGITQCMSRYPKQLSLGQCQRVLIAKALIKKPLLALFDEPFSNLDKPIADEIIDLLKSYCKENSLTAIFVSHDINQTFKLADKVFVMYDGKIIEQGKPEEIVKSKNPKVQELIVS